MQLKHTMKEERTELEENLDVAIEVQEHVMGQKVKAVKGELTVVKTKLTNLWEPRSRIGVHLGHSHFHAGSVALVFNPTTGHVSSQYHIVIDDDFSTFS